MRTAARLMVVLFVLLVPALVYAQGEIAGVVRDTSGAVLPGVTVEVASPALIEKLRSATTDGAGRYRIIDLRPGSYVITFTLAGFNTVRRPDVELSGSSVVTVDAEMRVGALEETVTVTGEAPVVDTQSTTRERVVSNEVANALPTSRMYYTLGVLIPGVNGNTRDVGGALGDVMGALSVHGSAVGDQRIMQNGVSVMTLTGTGNIGGAVPNVNAAQELAIDTSGSSAERQTGGVVINFIPRDGGNTMSGSVFVTGAAEGQQSNNYTQRLKDQGLRGEMGYKRNWDFNPGVGGALVKDRLWYFYSYRNNGAQNYAPGIFLNKNAFQPGALTYVPADGSDGQPARRALYRHANWWDSQIRTTWQVNSKNKVAATWDQQYRCTCPNGVNQPGDQPAVRTMEATGNYRFPHQRLLHAEWSSPMTTKLLIEAVALYRTERYGTMDLKQSDLELLNVAPELYANYPSMIGFTQVNGNAQVPNGLDFHGPFTTLSNNWGQSGTYRLAMTYVTGSHAFKVGVSDIMGLQRLRTYGPSWDALGRAVRYRVLTTGPNNNAPVFDQVTVYQTPYTLEHRQDHDMGVFAQDRWTWRRLTVNYGVRWDWYNSSTPAQTLEASSLGRPSASFAEISDTVDWKDVSPRFGAAYNLNGDGTTAFKVVLNRYVAGQALANLPATANPLNRLTNSVTRTWVDNNNNALVDCNLANVSAQGPTATGANVAIDTCGAPAGGANLMSTTPTDLVDWDVRRGWSKRSYNWEFSGGVQRQLANGVGLDVSYYRRWYGNFTATDNLAVAPADFRYFDVVVPVDSRLPGGGGNTLTQFVDFATTASATRQPNNKVVFADDIGATQIEHWNGVDVSLNARLKTGLLLQGGTSTGRRTTDNCEVTSKLPEMLGNSPQSVCRQVEPWRTQAKLVAVYALPRFDSLPTALAAALASTQVSATFQSIPGDAMQATYTMPLTELGNASFSSLATMAPCGGSANAGLCLGNSKSINLVYPSSVFDVRQNQLDVRVGRILRFGKTRTSLNFDVYNVLNEDTVLNRNNNFTKTASYNQTTGVGIDNQVNTVWVPTNVLQSRFFKLSATFDF